MQFGVAYNILNSYVPWQRTGTKRKIRPVYMRERMKKKQKKTKKKQKEWSPSKQTR